MIAGICLSMNFSNEETKIFFIETAIASMGLQDPVVNFVVLFGQNREIIGVVKDFHFESLHDDIKPLFFILNSNDARIIAAKIQAGRERETIERLQKFYETYNPGYTLDYKFLDEDYQALYAAEQRVSILSKYFAGLAILISCLGLFGLATFTVERRMKEIGIRKILGSGDVGIIRLLSSDFTKMVLIAIVIALPISYFITLNWLNDFAYRIELAWWFFVTAGLIALLIAWFTVSLHTFKASRINPVECLRNE
jgi:ABC-type antimicrobial peptide transport system permease subunit